MMRKRWPICAIWAITWHFCWRQYAERQYEEINRPDCPVHYAFFDDGLCGRGHTAELLGDETIRSIAEAHGVSPAQVILRWDLQRGIVVIPGSSNPEHIKENLDLFGFELSDEEMAAIRALDRNEKHDWYWQGASLWNQQQKENRIRYTYIRACDFSEPFYWANAKKFWASGYLCR